MLQAALRDGTADRRCVFEVFARRLPEGRRYGVVAGTGRLLEAIPHFRYDDAAARPACATPACSTTATCDWLADYRFAGDVTGYAEGEVFFPGSPVLTVEGTFAEAVAARDAGAERSSTTTAPSRRRPPGWRTPPATGRASRWARAAPTRRRPSPRPGRPTSPASRPPPTSPPASGTASRRPARRRTRGPCCTSSEADAFRAQVDALGRRHHAAGRHLRHRRRASGPPSRWPGRSSAPIRIDSGDLAVLAHQARAQLDELGAHRHPHRALRRPRRVRPRRPRDRTRRRVRRRHLRGHRLGRPDGRLRLQAGRGRGPCRGQALRGQDHPRRPQDRGPPAPGRPAQRPRRSSASQGAPVRRDGDRAAAGDQWSGAATCSPYPRWTSPARTCSACSRPCPGRGWRSPAASPRSPPRTRSPRLT